MNPLRPSSYPKPFPYIPPPTLQRHTVNSQRPWLWKQSSYAYRFSTAYISSDAHAYASAAWAVLVFWRAKSSRSKPLDRSAMSSVVMWKTMYLWIRVHCISCRVHTILTILLNKAVITTNTVPPVSRRDTKTVRWPETFVGRLFGTFGFFLL